MKALIYIVVFLVVGSVMGQSISARVEPLEKLEGSRFLVNKNGKYIGLPPYLVAKYNVDTKIRVTSESLPLFNGIYIVSDVYTENIVILYREARMIRLTPRREGMIRLKLEK